MAVEAVWGGEHSHDRQYPRQPAPKNPAEPGKPGDDDRHENQQQSGMLSQGSARLLLDDMNHVVKVQVVDPQGRVVQEIRPEDLATLNYHGVLVDLTT